MDKQSKLRDVQRTHRCKIEIWGNKIQLNELNESEQKETYICTAWAEIIPQTGKMQKGQAQTILTNVTHKIIIRYKACPEEIIPEMWILHNGKKYDVKYAINPYFRNEKWEIFVEEVIE